MSVSQNVNGFSCKKILQQKTYNKNFVIGEMLFEIKKQPRNLESSLEWPDSNCLPWSVLTVAGQPNLDVHSSKMTRQNDSAVISLEDTT